MELNEALKKYKIFSLEGKLYQSPNYYNSGDMISFNEILPIHNSRERKTIKLYTNKFLEAIEKGVITEPSEIDKILYGLK